MNEDKKITAKEFEAQVIAANSLKVKSGVKAGKRRARAGIIRY